MTISIDTLRSYVEGYPEGGRIERHSHDWDQLSLISQSAAIIETDEVYVVHPLMKALWLPAGVNHAIYSPGPFYLHALYFEPGKLRSDPEPQVLGLSDLARELVLLLCAAPRVSQRSARHAHALALLGELLPDARPESFSLMRPQSERARRLADYFSAHPEDGRAVLASITPQGRDAMQKATDAIVDARFGLRALSEEECDQLTWLLTMPREAAGDF